MQVQLFHDVGAVCVCGAHAHAELCGDFFVAVALCDELRSTRLVLVHVNLLNHNPSVVA